MPPRSPRQGKPKALSLKGQDVLLALHLADASTGKLSELAEQLGLSVGEVHSSLGRLQAAQLVMQGTRKVIRPNLTEFAVHGARYAFPPEMGGMARGVPTGSLAAPLTGKVEAPECAFVWKHPEGLVRAPTLSPIYASVPLAASKNPALHRKLALLDGLRTGGARVRELSAELLRKELERGS